MSTARPVKPYRNSVQNGEYRGYPRIIEATKKIPSARTSAKLASKKSSLLRTTLHSTTRNATQKPYVPGPFPVSDDVQQAVHRRVHAGMHAASGRPLDRDDEVGKQVTALIPNQPGGRFPVVVVSNRVIEASCAQASMYKLAGIPEHPCRYKREALPKDITEYPVVLLDTHSGVSSELIVAGKHGFAYMATPDLAELPQLGKFHLFNNPQSPQSVVDQGKTIETRKWRYAGLYVAHKSPLSMSLEGWQSLPSDRKAKAAKLHCYAAACQARRPEMFDEAHCRYYRDQLDSGAIKLRLVLLECIEFNIKYADGWNSLSALDLFPVKQANIRAPPPNREELARRERQEEKEKAMRAASHTQMRNGNRAPRV
ncbi:hypothetical protein BV20DRAFT_977799 [Pilatotrama ljubarskyi]|nr:hypothetical protein BV20DRAFT_977799 [Pilatotrama ljubarskyi]